MDSTEKQRNRMDTGRIAKDSQRSATKSNARARRGTESQRQSGEAIRLALEWHCNERICMGTAKHTAAMEKDWRKSN